MISFDSLSLLLWYKENRDFFENARIQKIQQPNRKDLILTIRKEGVSKKLYINIEPTFYHLCFMSKENEEQRVLENQKQPPMFCMLLRKYLEGAKILSSNVIDGERIFEINIERIDEFSKLSSLRLTVELMGKYSNIILYNSETKNIIGAAHNVGEEKSRERLIIGGLPYVYPTIRNKKFIEATSFNDFKEIIKKSDKKLHFAIAENYFHITTFVAQKFAEKFLSNYKTANIFSVEELKNLYNELIEYTTLKKITPNINSAENTFGLYLFGQGEIFSSINEVIDSYYAKNYSTSIISATQKMLTAKLNKDIAKYEKTTAKILSATKKDVEIQKLKKFADLIMTYQYQDIFHSEKITLYDYETEKNIEIDFDLTKTKIENANKYYKLYAKAKKASEINNDIIKQNNEKIAILKDYIFCIENTFNYKDLQEIKNEISGTKPQPNKNKQKQEINVPSVKINDFVVYIGKNNKQNDYIYSKISSPNDLWFHVLNQPSAHVLLKMPKNVTADVTILLECAKLAKLHSNAKNSGKTSVIYTKRQFIKRPPDTHAGYVTFRNETEIVVE